MFPAPSNNNNIQQQPQPQPTFNVPGGWGGIAPPSTSTSSSSQPKVVDQYNTSNNNNNNPSTVSPPPQASSSDPAQSTTQQQAETTNASISNRPHFQSDLIITDNNQLEHLAAADFQRPITYPSALHVKPPTITPSLKRGTSRWSEAKYCNPRVPSYVPPELILWGEGKPLQVFLNKARIEDMKRLHYAHADGVFFMRKDGELPEGFTGWPRHALEEAIQRREEEFEHERRVVNEALAAREVAALQTGELANKRRKMLGSLSNNLEYTRDGRIIHRIFFSRRVMDNRLYAAILGSRGTTHRLLEKETGCKISLGGRGITDMRNLREGTDIEEARRLLSFEPHCQILAPSELHLQRAIERVEFLVSDDPEAEELREKLKTKVDKDRGVKNVAAVGSEASLLSNAMKDRQQRREKQEKTGVVVNDDDEAGETAGEDTTADDIDAQDFLKNLNSL